MQKLLTRYQAKPNDKLAARIKAYDHKHPFPAMFLTAEQNALLTSIRGA